MLRDCSNSMNSMQWMNFGWGKNLSQEFNEHDRWCVDMSAMGPRSTDPVSVAIETVKSISKSHPGPYYLMASGGADSQSMLWAWKCSGIPFQVVSIKYIHNKTKEWMNEHDLVQLREFTDKHNIPVEYIDFDIINFLENDIEEYATKYQCASPHITTYMKMSECLDGGTVIFSGNFGSHSRFYSYTVYGLKRYAERSGRSIIPFFFLHDANIAGSIDFIAEGITITDIDVPEELRWSQTENLNYIANIKKTTTLLKYNYPIIPQPQKLTGFEKIKDYYDTLKGRVSPFERIKYSVKLSNRLFDLEFRYRLEDVIKYNDRIINIPEWRG